MPTPRPEVQIYDEPPGGFKKRRTPGACDLCKQRKIRCDSAKMPGRICSNCKAFNSECKHSSSKKKKGVFVNITSASESSGSTPHQTVNIVSSNDNFSFAKRQISVILDAPSYQVPANDNTLLHRTLTEVAAYARSLEKSLLEAGPRTNSRTTPEPLSNTSSYPSPSSSNPNVSSTSLHPTDPTALYSAFRGHGTSDDDGLTNTEPAPTEVTLVDSIKNLELEESVHSFFGKSSQLALMKTAMKIKEEYDGDTVDAKRTGTFELNEAGVDHGSDPDGNRIMQPDTQETHFHGKKRPAFWNVYPWQHLSLQLPRSTLTFPPPDLLASLVDLFFIHRNTFMPLLHRPTFLRDLDTKLHERDRGFGELVLSVCALGARFSSDERVFVDDAPVGSEGRDHNAGWKYMNQIGSMQEANPQDALYKVQTICNLIVFLSSTSSPGRIWALLSIGVRHAQAVGAHRRNFLGTKPSVKQELWKRAYWVLINLDSFTSAFLGRPKATDPAEYDLDLPIECDDEFWDHPDPKKAFKQPQGQPSLIAYWTAYLKLMDILAFAHKNIYAVKKPPELWGSSNVWGSSWDTRVVSELDSALNRWVDNIPDHLQWDPHKEDLIFFEQSSSLYCTYYFAQIHVHRPFIRPEIPFTSRDQHQQRNYSGMSYSSLAVCANAARSCLHVLDLHSKRNNFSSPQPSPSSYLTFPKTAFRSNPSQMTNSPVILFNSVIMILLNLWSGKRLGLATDVKREMEDVYLSVRILKDYEKKYQNAGRMCDIINELISVMEPANVGSGSGSGSRKRERDEDRDRNRGRVQKPWTYGAKGATETHVDGNIGFDANFSFRSQLSRFEDVRHTEVEYLTPNIDSAFSSFPVGLAPSSYQPNFPSHPEVPASSSMHSTGFCDQDITNNNLLELPLYTEDLGRLPIHLGSNHYWNRSTDHVDVNAYVGPSDGSMERTNEFGANLETGFQYADSSTSIGNNALQTNTLSAVPPEAWGLGVPSGLQARVDIDASTGLDVGFVGPEQYQDFKFFPAQNAYTNMFNATPARDGWFDWGTYLSSVDDLLCSIDSNQ